MTTRRQFLKRFGTIGGTALITAQAATIGTPTTLAVLEKPLPKGTLIRPPHGTNAPPPINNSGSGATPPVTNPPIANPPISPPNEGPAVAPGFTIARTRTSYPVFEAAHAAADDGDTILIAPTTYDLNFNGANSRWTIWKTLTLKSSVAGKRYRIRKRVPAGALGVISQEPCMAVAANIRATSGASTRLNVVIEDAEAFMEPADFSPVDLGAAGSNPLLSFNTLGTASIPGRGDLTLRRCYFHHAGIAIVGGDAEWADSNPTSTLTVESSVFEYIGNGSLPNNHHIYAGWKRMTFQGCAFRGRNYPQTALPPNTESDNTCPTGHMIKTLSHETIVRGCRFTIEDYGTNSAAIEASYGGAVTVTGSYFEMNRYGDTLDSSIRYGVLYDERNAALHNASGSGNRLTVRQNTFVNHSSGHRYSAQSGYVKCVYGPAGVTFPTGWAETSAIAIDIAQNVFAGPGTPPTSASAIIVGAPHASNAAVQLTDLIDESRRIAGWALRTPIAEGKAGSATVEYLDYFEVQTSYPTVRARSDNFYGARSGDRGKAGAASWYEGTILNGWWKLRSFPFFANSQQDTVQAVANPDDLATYKAIWPGYGSASDWDPRSQPWPWSQGKSHIIGDRIPVPGNSLDKMNGDQGAHLCENATVKRRGAVYHGTFLVWPAGGGHSGTLNNQILALGPLESDTPHLMDLTQPDFPPPSVLDPESPKNAWAGSREGFTRVGSGASGRPLSTHQYSSVQYIARSNTVIWTSGPAHAGGPKPGCTYAYRLDGDGWTGKDDEVAFPARFEDYFSTVGVDRYDALPSGIFSVQVVDNVADEVWCGLPNGSAGGAAIVRVNSTAQGSTYKYVELLNNGNNMIESTAAIGWALEGEPWLVYVSEFRPWAFHIVNRTYDAGPTGASRAQWEPRRRKSWNVNVVPLNGLAINLLPRALTGYGPGSQAGNAADALRSSICYDRVQRCFYAVVYQIDATPLMDVYRIVPAASDGMVRNIGGSESVADWTSEKLTKHAASITELPQPMRTDSPNTADGKEFYPQHGNLCVLQTPVHGLFFMHSTMTEPIFWRLS